MIIFDRLLHLANGGRYDYLHKRGKENKKVTNLQNFLDTTSQLKIKLKRVEL